MAQRAATPEHLVRYKVSVTVLKTSCVYLVFKTCSLYNPHFVSFVSPFIYSDDQCDCKDHNIIIWPTSFTLTINKVDIRFFLFLFLFF